MLSYDKHTKETYFFVDDYGMMMVQNPSWKPDGKFGEGDSINRTFEAFVAYEDRDFLEAIKNCQQVKIDDKGVYLETYRHPSRVNDEYNDMSRDHIIGTILILKWSNEKDLLKTYSKLWRYKISDRYSFTINLWYWMKGLAGSRFYRFLWYLIDIPILLVSVLWNKIIQLLAWSKFNEVSQSEYNKIHIRNEDLPKYYKKLRKLRFPTYSLNLIAWQVYVAPPSLGRWLMKQIIKIDVGKYNYLIKLLIGKKVKKEDIYNWKQMTGGRWSTRTDWTNDRSLGIIDDPDDKLLVSNVLDEDLIKKLYEIEKYTPNNVERKAR